jgi:hypothetical protein
MSHCIDPKGIDLSVASWIVIQRREFIGGREMKAAGSFITSSVTSNSNF